MLVVDDDPFIRAMLALALEGDGYTVLTAANGADALDLIARGGYRPDVILLDMEMPVMDGATFTAIYRRMGVPQARIILISASLGLEVVADEIAVDDSLGKPFDLDALSAAVREHAPAA